MLVDYHNHTTLCGHAIGTMEEYVERAMDLGIREYGFAEHSHWMIQGKHEWLAMRDSDLPRYVERVGELKRRYDREGSDPFHLRLGIEMDFVPSRLALAREISERYDWDYRLGSIHHLGPWNLMKREPDFFETHGPDAILELYFDQMRRLIESRFCDVVSHFDVIKRPFAPGSACIPYAEPLIPLLAESGMAVEINTSGMDREIREFYPSWPLVERMAAAGVPFTLGADAHRPSQVGRHLESALEGLRAIGVRHVVRFEKRRMIPVEIRG